MNNEEKILEMLSTLTEKVEKMDQRLDGMDQRLDGMDQRLEGMDQRLDGMDQRLEEVDQRSIRTQVLLENDITDRLQLLYEGHQTLLETLAPKSRVEALEEEVALMKSAFRGLSQDVAELKKAQ